MSKEKRRVPKLRFPGFTEDWEQRKLGDYLIQYTEITTQNNQYPVLTSSRKGLFFQTDYYDGNQIASKDNTGYNIVPYGYFTYRHMSDDDIFHFNINYIVDKGIVSTLYPVFTTKNLNSNYLQLQLNYGTEFRKYAVLLKQGGSRTYMYFNKLRDLKLTISTSIDEQEIIANFFIAFEKLITLHQRKLDNLKLKKKALLQKLFPKNGERYPELRFPGFTDAWEQRKLTDIAKTFIGLVTTMTENYRDSGTLLIRNSDIKEGQFIFSEKPIHLDGEFAEKNKTRRLQIGDVVTVHTGDIGTSAVIQEKEAGAIGFATINTRTDKRILNPYFLSTYFNTEKHKCYANSVSTGDGRSNYNIKDFNKLVISIPTLDEQEKISAVINNINTIITLHQRKLDHLKLQKKALLQQMFV